jgi:glycosyltransferase involved in cell wall biosynthesis
MSHASAWELGPTLSIVVPAFFEESSLPQLHRDLVAVLDADNVAWELIFVDDGSTDGTWRQIEALHRKDARVRGLRLSRNFGHQYALFAGLTQASGLAVVMMDGDLQHPPAVVPQLLGEWERGAKIVHTMRRDPPTLPWLKRVTSRLFYRIFSFLGGVKLSAGSADFRLLDRQVVDQLLRLREDGLFLRGLVHWVGFPSATVEFTCGERFAGRSKYNLGRMIRFAWTGVTSFSVVPLRLAVILGLITSLGAFYQLGEAVYIKLFTDRGVPGWASVIGLMSLLFGVLFILLGILGEYLARVLHEVRGRPRFIVRDAVGFDGRTVAEDGGSPRIFDRSSGPFRESPSSDAHSSSR